MNKIDKIYQTADDRNKFGFDEEARQVTLREIADVITKGTTPTTLGYDFQDEGINFLKIECFDEAGNYLGNCAHISEKCNEKLSRSKLQENDILFSIAGAIGRVAIVTEDLLPANTNQALAIIRISGDEVYLPYIKLILQSGIVRRQFEKQKQGVAQLNLSLKNIGDLIIPLFSKERQMEFVELFSKVQVLIDNRRSQLVELDTLIKARFVEMFGDPIQNEKGWDIVTFKDCLNSIENGKSFICEANVRTGNNPAILKLSAVTYGVYNPDENKAIINSEDFVEAAAVHSGDLLFTRKNTPELVGMAAYVSETPEKLMMPDLVFRLNTNNNCNKIFLWQLINHDRFRGKIKKIASGSAKSMSNISKERLGALEMYLPPMDLQNEFVAFVIQVDKLKVEVQKSLDEMQILFDSLMQEYFG